MLLPSRHNVKGNKSLKVADVLEDRTFIPTYMIWIEIPQHMIKRLRQDS